MTNLEKYNQAFMDTFDVSISDLERLEYKSIPAWDSVGHMSLIAAVEDVFDIEIPSDDIIDFSSYEKGKGILCKNGITL